MPDKEFDARLMQTNNWINSFRGNVTDSRSQLEKTFKKGGCEINYWLKYGNLSRNPVVSLMQRVKNKLKLASHRQKS